MVEQREGCSDHQILSEALAKDHRAWEAVCNLAVALAPDSRCGSSGASTCLKTAPAAQRKLGSLLARLGSSNPWLNLKNPLGPPGHLHHAQRVAEFPGSTSTPSPVPLESGIRSPSAQPSAFSGAFRPSGRPKRGR